MPAELLARCESPARSSEELLLQRCPCRRPHAALPKRKQGLCCPRQSKGSTKKTRRNWKKTNILIFVTADTENSPAARDPCHWDHPSLCLTENIKHCLLLGRKDLSREALQPIHEHRCQHGVSRNTVAHLPGSCLRAGSHSAGSRHKMHLSKLWYCLTQSFT